MCNVNCFSYELTHTSYFMNKLDEVMKWIRNMNMNVDLSRYSRYSGYIDDFYKPKNLDNYKKTGSLHDMEVKFKKLNEAAQECFQLVQIYDAFKYENSIAFKERLRKVVAGSDFLDVNNQADPARDFLYELLVASWFKSKWGYTIDFTQRTDVVAIKEDAVVYIECKRIKSIKALEQNFKKACKQLSLVHDTSTHYKVVFIDIYNCISDNLPDYEYSTVDEMVMKVNDVLQNNFRKQKGKLIEDILTSNLEYTMGVVLTTVRCLWLSNATPQLYQDYKVLASSKISDENFEKLKHIFIQ